MDRVIINISGHSQILDALLTERYVYITIFLILINLLPKV